MSNLRLRPSSAATWGSPLGCHGSVKMCAEIPTPEQDDNEAALEGTTAHWIAKQLLDCDFYNFPIQYFVDTIYPKTGVLITKEMVSHVCTYVDHIKSVYKTQIDTLRPPTKLQIEQTIKIPEVHPTCEGTPDTIIIIDMPPLTIHVFDFKYGFGIVEPFENYQLLCYASGILSQLGIDPRNEKVKICLHIIQPRAAHVDGPIRTWSIDGPTFVWYEDRLKYGASQAMSTDPKIRSGSHCHYCRARYACGTIQRCALYCVDFIGEATPEHLDVTALDFELGILEQATRALKARRTGIEEQLRTLLKQGKVVPGRMLEQTFGRLEWIVAHETIIQIGEAIGIELNKPDTLTPTQAIKKGASKEMVSGFVTRKPGAMKLVKYDNSRARKAFGAPLPKLENENND